MNAELSRAMPQGEGNPLNADPLGVEMSFLRLSQDRCQHHRCNTTYCLRIWKRTGDLANDMEGAAAIFEAANAVDLLRECRFNFPRASRQPAAVIRTEGKSYHVFEAGRNQRGRQSLTARSQIQFCAHDPPPPAVVLLFSSHGQADC